MSEEIVTGLSRFSYLRVIARSSTGRYANERVDVRSVGKELGARYAPPARSGVAVSSPTVAIAVLPCSDMSPGKDQDYLCEGMAEEVMNA